MDLATAARQLLLYGHLLAFAFAFATVVREDLALARADWIDPARLRRTAHQVLLLLVVLWLTGIAMLAMEGKLDPRAWVLQPKLAAKITVVSLLTVNGLLLHWIAFPLMTKAQRFPLRAAMVCVVLGAVSAVGWSYSAFLGVARVIAPTMRYSDFLALFGLTLAAALLVGLTLVLPRLERLLGRWRRLSGQVEKALRRTFGGSSELILDADLRRRHGHDPVAYAQALADRIPAEAEAGRQAFLKRIAPLLRQPG